MAPATTRVTVTQTATVSTFFLRRIRPVNPSHSPRRPRLLKAGGNAKPLNVMFVLDATGSMGDADSNCTVPGFTTGDARQRSERAFQCALYSIQSVLKVMPASLDKVGLMIFPGTEHPVQPDVASLRDAAARRCLT